MPIAIYVLLVIIVSAFIHNRTQTLAGPSLLSAVICSSFFHLAEYVVVGHFDSLVMVSVVVSVAIGFFVAAGVGVLMRRSGKKGVVRAVQRDQ